LAAAGSISARADAPLDSDGTSPEIQVRLTAGIKRYSTEPSIRWEPAKPIDAAVI
jgi:hypothetical protein